MEQKFSLSKCNFREGNWKIDRQQFVVYMFCLTLKQIYQMQDDLPNRPAYKLSWKYEIQTTLMRISKKFRGWNFSFSNGVWQFVTIKMFLRNNIVITNFSSRFIVFKVISSDQKLRLMLAVMRAPSFPENRWVSLPVNPSSFLIYSQAGLVLVRELCYPA